MIQLITVFFKPSELSRLFSENAYRVHNIRRKNDLRSVPKNVHVLVLWNLRALYWAQGEASLKGREFLVVVLAKRHEENLTELCPKEVDSIFAVSRSNSFFIFKAPFRGMPRIEREREQLSILEAMEPISFPTKCIPKTWHYLRPQVRNQRAESDTIRKAAWREKTKNRNPKKKKNILLRKDVLLSLKRHSQLWNNIDVECIELRKSNGSIDCSKCGKKMTVIGNYFRCSRCPNGTSLSFKAGTALHDFKRDAADLVALAYLYLHFREFKCAQVARASKFNFYTIKNIFSRFDLVLRGTAIPSSLSEQEKVRFLLKLCLKPFGSKSKSNMSRRPINGLHGNYKKNNQSK